MEVRNNMQYYNYKRMKKNTAEQSAKVVEKYRQQFAHNMEMYNYTDKGKKRGLRYDQQFWKGNDIERQRL